jgi:5-methylcytosine-specific restriction protein A
MKFSNKTKKILLARSKGLCEYCNKPVDTPQYHHRRPRGMGGTKRTNSGDPENGVVVHLHCHISIESDREQSLFSGFLVWQSHDPLTTPIVINGEWFLLNNDGTKTLQLSSPAD